VCVCVNNTTTAAAFHNLVITLWLSRLLFVYNIFLALRVNKSVLIEHGDHGPAIMALLSAFSTIRHSGIAVQIWAFQPWDVSSRHNERGPETDDKYTRTKTTPALSGASIGCFLFPNFGC